LRDSVGKSIFDVTAATLLLLLAAPLFAIIAAAVKLTSRGTVLYRQTRVGNGGRLFPMLKFRSMVANAAQTGPWYTEENDPRVTWVGRVLRSASLDELPQLINVIRGEMSLVGPRPPVPLQLGDYTEEDRRILFSVKPGITGLAQVMGRSSLPVEARTSYSIHYALHRTMLMDLGILARTAWAVVTRQGTN
jgi:lipopolysaccharide/colanic/teichoic acid biosynthesis glycosyltransferase